MVKVDEIQMLLPFVSGTSIAYVYVAKLVDKYIRERKKVDFFTVEFSPKIRASHVRFMKMRFHTTVSISYKMKRCCVTKRSNSAFDMNDLIWCFVLGDD